MNGSIGAHSEGSFNVMANRLSMFLTPAGMFRVLLLSFFVSFLPEPAGAQEISRDGPAAEVEVPVSKTELGKTVKPTSRAGQLILVVGAAGAEEFGEAFAEWGQRWRKVAAQSDLSFMSIGLDGKQEGNSDRDSLRKALMVGKGSHSTPLWLVLIGHGTYARDVAKFNLRGPDVSGADLAEWLQGVERPVVIINCASASGPFVNRLSGPRRVVVTATRSGIEQNYARFGDFLSQAIGSQESDLDHDGEVSIHEAFLRASAGVRMFYDAADRIATEHAIIDDNGDGKGTPATMFRGVRPNAKAKNGDALDGAAALRVTVTPSGRRLPFTAMELKQRAELEDQIDVLRGRVGELDQQALDAALLPLMLQLSRLYQTAQKREQASEN